MLTVFAILKGAEDVLRSIRERQYTSEEAKRNAEAALRALGLNVDGPNCFGCWFQHCY